MIEESTLLEGPLGPQWAKVGVRHHHGINLSLLSIRTKESCGNGEFFDLIPLIDWCAEVGLDVIQLLPLNDSGDDPSPYFALSATSLNPLFLSLHKLPNVTAEELLGFAHFNGANRVPYAEVQSHKFLFFRNYYEKMGSELVSEKPFQDFIQEHSWVLVYGLFKVLKDLMAKHHWNTWPTELQNLQRADLSRLIQQHQRAIHFYVLLQFLCYTQLKEVRAYANRKGVLIKGDIPILISPDSADVWQFTDEFDLNLSAGSPPDIFTEEGQVWGLPIFRWDVMRKKNFDWWKRRLSYAEHFFDLYRIDHVIGFYRIWAIPMGGKAKEGVFIPEQVPQWLKQGEELLRILPESSSMLPIAEDLGIIPDSLRISLSNLGICGTKVLRWEKRDEGEETYLDPLHYNPISMTTLSTHDSETVFQWWRDRPEEAKVYAKYKRWTYTPILSSAQRREMLWDSHHSASLFHINLLGEYLALFPELVWDNPDWERINVPGTVTPTNWTYRIRPSIEEIASHQPLKVAMKELIKPL